MNATVDMRFSGEVENGVAAVRHRINDSTPIADVTSHKRVSPDIEVIEVLEIPRVGERVEVDDLHVVRFGQDLPDERRTDKAGAAGDEDSSHNQNSESGKVRK